MIRILRPFFTLIAILFCHTVFSQISLPLNTIVTENFNSIGTSATATLPANWRMSTAGNAAGGWSAGVSTTTVAANSGLPSAGGRYNWATTSNTDRAIGFLSSASYSSPNAVMAYYRNTTGASVNTITVSFSIERYVVNTVASSISFASSTDGISWSPQSAGNIAANQFGTGANAGTFDAPLTVNKTATVNIVVPNNGDIYFRWIFSTSNAASQGLGLDDVSVFAGTATPVLTAKLKDTLQVDNGVPGQPNEGDGLRYRTTIKNIGTGDATNIQLNEPPPSNTTLTGAYKTSVVARDDNYTSSFNTLYAGATVLANDFGIPMPTLVQTFGPVSNPAATAAGSAGTTSAGGVLTVNTDGSFSYMPPTGFSGVDQFKYVTGNGNLPNNDAVVSINVSADILIAPVTTDPTCNNGTNGCITINAIGGNPPLQYSIDAGGYVGTNSFCGLSAGLHNLAVKDAGGYIKTGTATLNNPLAITVSGSIPNLLYNTAMTPLTFTKTNGVGSPANPWSATGLPAGVSINTATGTVSGTPTATGPFNATITYTDANGCTGSTPAVFNVAPKLVPDFYNVVGNTQLVADGHSTPTTPFTSSAINIITNDVNDVTVTVTPVTNAPTANGGSITIASNGKFTYSPPVGVFATDTYIYTASANGVSSTATITFIISNKIWYVNNTYAGANGAANGTSARPYTDVAAAEAASLANDYIYVHTGTGNTNGNALLKPGQTLRGAGSALNVGALTIAATTKPVLTGMITLANTVTVDGFDMNTGATTAFTNAAATVTGVNVNVGTVTTTTGTGITLTGTGNNVTMTLASLTTNGAVNAVTLTNTAGTITINGGTQTGSTGATFNISGGTLSLTYSGSITQAANAAMVSISGGHTTGTITFNTGTLSATNGTGLQFDNANGTYNFNGTTTLNGGDAGIDILNGSAGTFTFSSNTSITNPTNEAIKINASSATVNYPGTFSKTNNAVTGILINGETGGTITINGTGTKTLSTSTANAISLTTNTGATINFSGNNLLLTTTSGVGFNATGGGTISLAGTGNTITSTTGTALNVANTTIGAGNLNFQSISANGGTNGIILDNTGSSGSLTVTGTIGSVTRDNSGGTIQNLTGADGATAGHGVYLNSTLNPSLNHMNIHNNQGDGIHGNSVNGFTLTYTSMTTNGTTTAQLGNFHGEGDVNFVTLVGSAVVNNNDFQLGYYNTFGVFNDVTPVSLNRIVMSSNTFGANDFTGGNAGVVFRASGGTMNITFGSSVATGNTITGAGSNTFILDMHGVMSADLIMKNNAISNNHGNIVTGGGGVSLQSGGAGDQVTFTFNVDGNTFSGSHGAGFNIGTGVLHNGQNFSGTFNNNTIGIQATANSGSTAGNDLFIQNSGSTMNINVTNNRLYQYNPNGTGAMQLQVGDDGSHIASTKFVVTGNTISNPGSIATAALQTYNGIQLNSGPSGPDAGKTCLTISGNVVSGSGNAAQGSTDIRLRQRALTDVYLPGYGGAVNDATAVNNYVIANNPGATSSALTANSPPHGFGGNCPF